MRVDLMGVTFGHSMTATYLAARDWFGIALA